MIKKYRQGLDVIAEKQALREEERGTEAGLKRIFSEIDADGNGTLSKGEMMVALKHMGACARDTSHGNCDYTTKGLCITVRI